MLLKQLNWRGFGMNNDVGKQKAPLLNSKHQTLF